MAGEQEATVIGNGKVEIEVEAEVEAGAEVELADTIPMMVRCSAK